MKKILIVFGTRPEAIKMCPLIKELERRSNINVEVCVTGQHRGMLDQVLNIFDVTPNYDLKIMKKGQTLFDITVNILKQIEYVYNISNPDLVLVHGDTTTTFVAALAAFYKRIKIGHVEAGLRTGDIYSSFPEEFNRKSVSLIADYNFAPTEQAKENLLKELCLEKNIFVTGNTAIDALKYTVNRDYHSEITDWAKDSKLILLTAHRRENLGVPLKNILSAVNNIVERNKNVKVVYPVHKNPIIRKQVKETIGNNERIKIVEPLDVIDFHNLMANSYMILTDSGGIQEEAPSMGKPVLVLRNTTERPEGVLAGTLKLVGTDRDKIISETEKLINNEDEYYKMSNIRNPYGDGNSSKMIADIVCS